MNKRVLIKRWLDNELTVEGFKEFQQLEESLPYTKLSENAQLFKAPEFNNLQVYKKLHQTIVNKKSLILPQT